VGGSPRIYAGEGALQRSGRSFCSDHALQRWWSGSFDSGLEPICEKGAAFRGEFFLHLFTITVSLLIAIGIEAAVERYQHRELASEARNTMTAEILKNSQSVTDALRDIENNRN
jgi:hypothetical protein